MHVLIDLRWMIPGFTGGIETMARALVDTLLRTEDENEYTLLIPMVTQYDFILKGHPNFRIMVSDGPTSYIDALRSRIPGQHSDRIVPSSKGIWVNNHRIQA